MNTYPQKKSWHRHPAAIAMLSLALAVPALFAQVAPAAKPNDSKTKPLDDENTIKLSPFVVNTSEDEGYRATNTLAGTRLRTSLEDVGSVIQVITEKFLADTGATNSESLLVLTTNTETASTRGNMASISASDRDADETGKLSRVNTNTRVRGLGAADNTRDFFLTDIPWDSYNVGRVDLQRGPNSILFGLGQPSGIINASLNSAAFKNSGKLETRVGSYGSHRGSFDFNRVLLKSQLAIRVSGLYDRTEYQQRPAFNEDRRGYVAVRYDPAFLSKRGTHFSLKANFEAGHINQDRPRQDPPIDRITPWFNTTPVTIPANVVAGTAARTFAALNRSVYDNYTAYRGYDPAVPGSGAVGSNVQSFYTPAGGGPALPNPNYQPGISEIYTDGAAIYFPDPNSAAIQSGVAAIISESTRTAKFGIGSNGKIDGNINGLPYARIIGLTEPWKLAQFYNRPFYGAYLAPSLLDPTVFDFYHKLIDAGNKPSTRDFSAYNFDLSETIFDNRAGISLVYDHQDYRDHTDSLFTDRYQAINVDINATLMDGSPNPNVGRPFVSARSNGGGFGMKTERTSFRVTGFAELRADDFFAKSLLTRILGKHVITGVHATDNYSQDSRNWSRFLMDQGWPITTQGINTITSRSLQIYQYIGPDMRTRTSPAGLNLSGVGYAINPTTASVRYFDSRWQPPVTPATAGYVDPAAVWVDPFNGATRTQSENPANYGGWKNYQAQVLNSVTDGADPLTTGATLQRSKLTTNAINWQGYLWDNTFIPLYGFRRDTNKVYTTRATVTAAGIALVNDPSYSYTTTPRAVLTTEIRSYGGVLHMPPFLRGKLPWGSSISLTYNKSSNFNPSDTGRVDMLNRPLDPSQGATKDYGVLLTMFDNKLALRVTKFKSSVQNASFNWGAPQSWLFDDEARGWQQASRLKAGLSGDPRFAGNLDYNYYEQIAGVNTITPASIARQKRDVDNYFAAVPTALFAAGGLANPGESTWVVGQGNLFVSPNGAKPTGYTATRDTISEGTEWELTFAPTKNWNIAANASSTKAVTTNNVGDLAAWLDVRDAFWNGPAGDMLLFHNRIDDAQASNTIRADWNNNVGYNYAFQKYTNGANVQEMPKWRGSLTTSYTFTEGFLKDVRVGGSYRYSQSAKLGYPWTYLTVAGKQVEVPDITKPVYGKATNAFDLMFGYGRNLKSKVRWDIQLNLRNAFGKNTLIPVTVNPDGAYATYRIVEGPSWTLTNTFKF